MSSQNTPSRGPSFESTWTILPSLQSTSLPDHIAAVKDVLTVAQNHDLYFKPEKCTFHAPSIDYLGVILEKGITRMDPTKIAGIKNWPTPTKVKDVRSFLGFCNFYSPFIRGFCSCCTTSKRTHTQRHRMELGEETTRSIRNPQNRVTSEPVLAHPELDKQFELEVDASGFAIGGVLLQKKARWQETPHRILLHYAQHSRTKLRHLRPGTLGHRKRTGQLETTTCWIPSQNHRPLRSSKPAILERTQKISQTSSKGSPHALRL